MVWFYTREQQSLTVETRYDNDAQVYVATIVGGTGVPQTERFQSAEALRTWLQTLERKLAADRWDLDGAPYLLPDGWPDKRPPQ